MQIKPMDLVKEIRTGTAAPLMLAGGAEGFFLDEIENALLESVLSEEEKAFNLDIVYGSEVNAEQLISIAKSYPMMAEKRLLLVREAQSLHAREWEKLMPYLKAPSSSTILAFIHRNKDPDKRKTATKAFIESKQARFSEAKPMSEEGLVDFIVAKAGQNQLKFDAKAAFALKELLGSNLARIVSEIEKIRLSVPAGAEIKLEKVIDQVGLSREFNMFDVPAYLAQKNEVRLLRTTMYMARNTNKYPLPVLVGVLYNFYSKLLAIQSIYFENQRLQKQGKSGRDPFRVIRVYDPGIYQAALKTIPMDKTARSLQILREYDRKSKGIDRSGASEDALMKELMLKLLHP
ncbi:MAG: DNA polymerase III subunit delta [Bacteroidetes bacterium]|nr:DNA polymerase III subunit delta [Bacteroidota bacterium]